LKVLIDTNIIVDNFARRDEFGDSLGVLNLCENGGLEGVVSTVTIMDVMYIMRKHLNSAEARDATFMLMQIVEVVPVLKSDINAALTSDLSDFEGAVQAACAARVKADYIITRNVRDFKNSPVPAILPGDITIVNC
jgi:predicted nucleic acid-binding protein